ncbi:MAG TPA: polyphosphate polymerase domain-containing protein [Prolixibacteraceae bacterium]|nr:polyphosphate polymerase domain-containing protein [Prolixibacteraceae bacterium]
MISRTTDISTEFKEKRREKDSNPAEVYPESILTLPSAISSLQRISLQEMAQVKLMNRVEAKYLVSVNSVPAMLQRLSNHYVMQEIIGNTLAEYETVYLDTEGLDSFLSHINGKLNRFKWRIRNYVESDLCFLEIKNKTNKGRVEKNRIPYNAVSGLNDFHVSEFINRTSGLTAESLFPVLKNKFNRITLVNSLKTERLTIDLNISFQNCLNGESATLGNLAIIELKQEKSAKSVAGEYFESIRIKKRGISKYCLGMVLTSDRIKGNLYKQKIRHIAKIANLL